MPDIASVDASFPLCALSSAPQVRGARIIMRSGSHDLAVLTLTDTQVSDRLISGAPVVVSWRSSTTTEGTFYGYVYKASPHYGKEPFSRVMCIGLSYPLLNQHPRAWTDATAATVVRDLAREARLAANVIDSGRTYPQVTQAAGESSWRVLTRLADRSGMVLRVEGASVIFRDREDFTRTYRPSAPVLRYGTADDFTRFEPSAGAYTPEMGAANVNTLIQGLDQSGGLLTGTQAPATAHASLMPVFQQVSPVAVSSVEELEEAKHAAGERNRLNVQAKAECLGRPQLTPEREVFITGVSGKWNGYWTIREVTHTIRKGTYRCELSLGTDGLGGALPLSNESTALPVAEPDYGVVNPHRDGTLGAAVAVPVLHSSALIVGDPGRPLTDFAWSASVVNWR